MAKLKKKDVLYYARILPSVRIYEVCEIKIRTVEDTWFVGIEKREKHAFLFSYSDIGKSIFFDRNVALDKIKEAEMEMDANTDEAEEILYQEY